MFFRVSLQMFFVSIPHVFDFLGLEREKLTAAAAKD
jgi:hypothetical protein